MPKTSTDITEVYSNLQRLCRHKGVTLREACESAGVPFKTVNRWRSKTPHTLATYQALLDVLQPSES